MAVYSGEGSQRGEPAEGMGDKQCRIRAVSGGARNRVRPPGEAVGPGAGPLAAWKIQGCRFDDEMWKDLLPAPRSMHAAVDEDGSSHGWAMSTSGWARPMVDFNATVEHHGFTRKRTMHGMFVHGLALKNEFDN